MRWPASILAAAAACAGVSCSHPPPPVQDAKADPPRITQFYATAPKLSRGEKELLCYGVENAKTVRLSPPAQELSASPSRCVEVNPTETTTYTLTAEGAGQPVTQQLTVTLGAAKVKIVEVKVSTVDLRAGDQLSICYQVSNATSVEIEPIHFRGGSKPQGCTMTAPTKTTTYLLSAKGADGDQDQERVTVKVH